MTQVTPPPAPPGQPVRGSGGHFPPPPPQAPVARPSYPPPVGQQPYPPQQPYAPPQPAPQQQLQPQPQQYPPYQQTGTVPWQQRALQASPPTHMVLAVISVFFFLFTGIPSIYYASLVTQKVALGDFAGAHAASNRAQTLAWISIAIGVVLAILVVAANGGTSTF